MPEYGKYSQHDYLNFFQLKYNPFPAAPDDSDFYVSKHNESVISRLTSAILSRKGFMLLTGDIGLGKTTISRRIMQILDEHHVATALIYQSFLQETALLNEIVKDFGLQADQAGTDISGLMEKLVLFLLENTRKGINCAIIIDEAQHLTLESLELVRMISNLESDKKKLVQILLVGQPELLDTLNRHELRQLKSRIASVQHCIPLTQDQTGQYIRFKLAMAGDTGRIHVTSKAVHKLFELTCGNLRRINLFMDHCLELAFLERTSSILPQFMTQAQKALNIDRPASKTFRVSAGLILMLFLFIAAGIGIGSGIFYLNYHERIQAPLTAKSPAHPSTVKKTVLHPVPPPKMPIPSPAPVNHKVSEPVLSFLAAYGLKTSATDFKKGLENAALDNTADRILRQTGFQLISLTTLSPAVKEKYHVLSGVHPATGEKTYYLFWRPVCTISHFDYRYHGPEIIEVQKMLRQLKLYHYRIDGIVGHRMINGVKDFQNRHQLPATGFPDPETIFLMAVETADQ